MSSISTNGLSISKALANTFYTDAAKTQSGDSNNPSAGVTAQGWAQEAVALNDKINTLQTQKQNDQIDLTQFFPQMAPMASMLALVNNGNDPLSAFRMDTDKSKADQAQIDGLTKEQEFDVTMALTRDGTGQDGSSYADKIATDSTIGATPDDFVKNFLDQSPSGTIDGNTFQAIDSADYVANGITYSPNTSGDAIWGKITDLAGTTGSSPKNNPSSAAILSLLSAFTGGMPGMGGMGGFPQPGGMPGLGLAGGMPSMGGMGGFPSAGAAGFGGAYASAMPLSMGGYPQQPGGMLGMGMPGMGGFPSAGAAGFGGTYAQAMPLSMGGYPQPGMGGFGPAGGMGGYSQLSGMPGMSAYPNQMGMPGYGGSSVGLLSSFMG